MEAFNFKLNIFKCLVKKLIKSAVVLVCVHKIKRDLISISISNHTHESELDFFHSLEGFV